MGGDGVAKKKKKSQLSHLIDGQCGIVNSLFIHTWWNSDHKEMIS